MIRTATDDTLITVLGEQCAVVVTKGRLGTWRVRGVFCGRIVIVFTRGTRQEALETWCEKARLEVAHGLE